MFVIIEICLNEWAVRTNKLYLFGRIKISSDELGFVTLYLSGQKFIFMKTAFLTINLDNLIWEWRRVGDWGWWPRHPFPGMSSFLGLRMINCYLYTKMSLILISDIFCCQKRNSQNILVSQFRMSVKGGNYSTGSSLAQISSF